VNYLFESKLFWFHRIFTDKYMIFDIHVTLHHFFSPHPPPFQLARKIPRLDQSF
jgi:hypothetical protein